jgi:hypothetical protein
MSQWGSSFVVKQAAGHRRKLFSCRSVAMRAIRMNAGFSSIRFSRLRNDFSQTKWLTVSCKAAARADLEKQKRAIPSATNVKETSSVVVRLPDLIRWSGDFCGPGGRRFPGVLFLFGRGFFRGLLAR